MSLSEDFIHHLPDEIGQLLRDGLIDEASILAEKIGDNAFRFARCFREDGIQEELDDEGNGNDTTIYAIGSLTKLFVAVFMSIIVNNYSLSQDEEHKRYRRLRDIPAEDPWDIPFTTLFNHFSDVEMEPLPKNPSLRHVFLHYNSLPSMNAILLGPEGTSLMSKSQFLRVAQRLAQTTHADLERSYFEYSNGNYILAGILIEAIGGDSLANLLEMHLFKPLGMTNTYMSIPDSSVPVARPHIISTLDGKRKLSKLPPYPADAAVIPAMGGFSNTRDMAIFARSLLQSIKIENTVIGQQFIEDLFKPGPHIVGNDTHSHTLCGICTTLDTSIPGINSINRLIAPDDRCSTYPLGLTPSGNQVNTYYSAGAITGYASCLYIMPRRKTFVIVLTNTSGRIDASDHISRLFLQEIFKLERTPLIKINPKLPRIVPGLDAPAPNQVDILEMSSRNADKGEKVLAHWAKEDHQSDLKRLPPIQLEGTYTNRVIEQSIVIGPINDGAFTVNIKGEYTSRDMGLVRTGANTIRLCPLPGAEFTIDRYDPFGWKDLSFELSVEADEKIVTCLTRRSALGSHEFKRE
jgi:CubicO group peptidase (beta-lactamase class C family)